MTKLNGNINDLAKLIQIAMTENKKIEIPTNGASMLPMLKPYSSCVTLARADCVEKYDVIFYLRPNGQYVLHRLVSTKNGFFDAIGDGEYKVEHNIPMTSIVAKVVAFSSNGKTHNIDEKKYLRYVKTWVFFRPIRKLLLGAYKLFLKNEKK